MNMVNYQQMPPPPHYSPSYTNNPNYSASSLQLPHANSNPNMQHYQQPLPHSHSHPNLIQQSSSNITQIPIQQQQQPQTLQQWQFQQPQNPQSSNPSQYTKPLPPLNSSQPAVQQYQQMFIPVQQDVVNPPSQAKNNVGYGYASQNSYMPPQNYPYVYASHHSNDASSNSSVSNSLSNSENNPNQRFVKSDNKMVTHLSYEKQYPPLHNRNASDSNNYLTHSSRPNSGSPTVQSYLPPYSDVAVYSPLSQPQQMAPSRPLSSQHHQQQQHHQQLPATSRPPNPTNPAYQQPCSVVNSSNLTPDQQPASQHSFYGSQLIAPGQYPDSRLPDQNLVSYPGGYGYQVNNNMYTSNTSYIPATSYNYNNSTNNNINHATFGSNHMDKKFVPELKRGYENLEDESSKKSSIAGVIYNSSAVFKRLKPCLAEEKTESIYKQESNRSQGRPFSSNLTGRFIFHGGLKSLLNHVDKKNNNKFVVYNMDKKWDTDDSTATEKKDKEVNNVDATDRGENNLPSKESDRITQILFKNLKDSLNDNSGFRMGIINDKLNSEITMEALDTFLNCKHDDVLKIDGYREQYNPTQKVISYNPKTKVNIKSSVQSEIKSEEVIGPEVQLKVDDGKDDASPNPNPETIPDRRFNFHLLIKEAFGFEDYVFVKTIRDNNGHILKLETIKPPSDEKGDYNYSPEWLKRRICYPRYKGGMNLHILGPEFNFVLYNDLKMLLWDIKEEILGRDDKSLDKFLNSSALNIIDDDLKKKLFGNRIVYTQTLDR